MNRLTAFSLFLIGSLVFETKADILLDLDGSTPTIESNLTIIVGSQLNIVATEVGSVSPLRDRIGVDVYYQLPSDTATAVPLATSVDSLGAPALTRALPFAGQSGSGMSEDVFIPASAISPGTGLRAGTLSPSFGYLDSIGGVGYTANPTAPDFPNTFPAQLMGWDFSFPTVGVVHLGVCGILDGANGAPTLVPGNVYHEMDSNTPFPTVCGPGVRVEVVGVPEPPAAFLLSAAVGMCAFGTWKKKWNVRAIHRLVSAQKTTA